LLAAACQDGRMADSDARLSRAQISDSVADTGWRYVLGVLRTAVPVASPAHAAALAGVITTEAGEAAISLQLDLRPDLVIASLQDRTTCWVGPAELAAARRITEALAAAGLRTDGQRSGDPASGGSRAVQLIEIAIDAIDIAAIRPFWRAVLAYGDEPGNDGPEDAIVDPHGRGPAVWFQQMDAPRPQRNRIHLDISVPHDEAAERIRAALSAGGVLVSDTEAPAFWVLADREGNEACVTTWQGRDSAPTPA
jgi:4a-hydroxytetrahydrobiopterin dehydratase